MFQRIAWAALIMALIDVEIAYPQWQRPVAPRRPPVADQRPYQPIGGRDWQRQIERQATEARRQLFQRLQEQRLRAQQATQRRLEQAEAEAQRRLLQQQQQQRERLRQLFRNR